jgi:hypothetical protein
MKLRTLPIIEAIRIVVIIEIKIRIIETKAEAVEMGIIPMSTMDEAIQIAPIQLPTIAIHQRGSNRMIPVRFQDISAILGDSVFKTRQIPQRLPQGPLKLLDVMHTSMKALVDAIERPHEPALKLRGNQPLILI